MDSRRKREDTYLALGQHGVGLALLGLGARRFFSLTLLLGLDTLGFFLGLLLEAARLGLLGFLLLLVLNELFLLLQNLESLLVRSRVGRDLELGLVDLEGIRNCEFMNDESASRAGRRTRLSGRLASVSLSERMISPPPSACSAP